MVEIFKRKDPDVPELPIRVRCSLQESWSIDAPQLRLTSLHHLPHAKHWQFRNEGSVLRAAMQRLSHIMQVLTSDGDCLGE